MGRIVAASLLSVAAGVVLGRWNPAPANALGPVVWMVGWGLAVVALLGQPDSSRGRVLGQEEGEAGRTIFRLIMVALMVRAPLYAWSFTLSDDVHRYVWEGRVWAAGFSPFALAPDDPALAPLHDANWALVNHRNVSSIYPPLAQLLFVLLHPLGVSGFKAVSCLADCGTAVVLWRREARLGWLWACLPLPAVESAANGHLEAIGGLLVALALGGSAAAAWLGAMLKLLPGILLVRLRGWRAGLAGVGAALALLPLVGPGSLRGLTTYEANWSFNGSIYPAAAWLLGDGLLARRLLLGVGLLVVGTAVLRVREPARLALWGFGAFALLSPTVHPWYLLWPLLPALWVGVDAWVWLAALAPISYLVLGTGTPEEPAAWHENPLVRWVEYTPFYLLLFRGAWLRFSRAGP